MTRPPDSMVDAKGHVWEICVAFCPVCKIDGYTWKRPLNQPGYEPAMKAYQCDACNNCWYEVPNEKERNVI